MGKCLEFKMLTDAEKAEYMTLVNVPNWAERADRHAEAADDTLKIILTAGMSSIFRRGMSLFEAIRGSAGDVSRRESIAKFLIKAARNHNCDSVDRTKFPSVERWGFGCLEGIEPVDKLLFHSQLG